MAVLGTGRDPFPYRPMTDLITGQHDPVEPINLSGREHIETLDR